MNKLLNEIANIEFLNNIDKISLELLYSNEKGYTHLLSKKAILEKENYLRQFDFEIKKISDSINYDGLKNLIEEKKEEFKNQILKHYNSEVISWIDEVYDDFLENIFFIVSSNKENISLLKKYYNNSLNIINWYCFYKKIDDNHKKILVDNFNKDFKNALNDDDTKYLKSPFAKSTNFKVFFELWKKILDNSDEFKKINLNSYNKNLKQEDIKKFQSVQKILNTNKKNIILDEINLLDYVLNKFNNITDEEKYLFLDDIQKDFSSINPSLLDEDKKIQIVKKRINLFRINKNEKAKEDYYKKLLNF